MSNWTFSPNVRCFLSPHIPKIVGSLGNRVCFTTIVICRSVAIRARTPSPTLPSILVMPVDSLSVSVDVQKYSINIVCHLLLSLYTTLDGVFYKCNLYIYKAGSRALH